MEIDNVQESWWINMKKNQLYHDDITNVETKRNHVEQYLGISLSNIIAEYCKLVKCESKTCDQMTLWRICSLDCAYDVLLGN